MTSISQPLLYNPLSSRNSKLDQKVHRTLIDIRGSLKPNGQLDFSNPEAVQYAEPIASRKAALMSGKTAYPKSPQAGF